MAITAETLMYVSGVLYGVGIATGITLTTAIAFHVLCGAGKILTNRHYSMKILYMIAIFNLIYFQVKVPQLNGINNDCGTQEALSVLFYLGSNCLLYIFFLVRYIEVYGWVPMALIPVALVIAVFAASIPVSIVSNVTVLEAGSCSVYHPPISAWLPTITSFIISVYMLILFLLPIFKSSSALTKVAGAQSGTGSAPTNKSGTSRRGPPVNKTAVVLFVTNAIAITSTVLFNATLSTPAGKYAPLTSSLDLMINFVAVTTPYFLSKLSGTHSTAAVSGTQAATAPVTDSTMSRKKGANAAKSGFADETENA